MRVLTILVLVGLFLGFWTIADLMWKLRKPVSADRLVAEARRHKLTLAEYAALLQRRHSSFKTLARIGNVSGTIGAIGLVLAILMLRLVGTQPVPAFFLLLLCYASLAPAIMTLLGRWTAHLAHQARHHMLVEEGKEAATHVVSARQVSIDASGRRFLRQARIIVAFGASALILRMILAGNTFGQIAFLTAMALFIWSIPLSVGLYLWISNSQVVKSRLAKRGFKRRHAILLHLAFPFVPLLLRLLRRF